MYLRIRNKGLKLLNKISDSEIKEEDIKNVIIEIIKNIEYMKKNLKVDIYNTYAEFFYSFEEFCLKSIQYEFFIANIDMMKSSLELFVECMEEIIKQYEIKTCVCCENKVIYAPLSKYYSKMLKKVDTPHESKSETLNLEEYFCPLCGASDRDRLIISFLVEKKLQKAAEGTKVLQFAPTKVISNWIKTSCPHLDYETTDLYMDDVTYKSDIQHMSMVQNNTYDIIICSHVLEHVQDDRKAMQEMRRILKPEGKIIFLVPIDLNICEIDEEWGLTEDESWRRFGQGDYCRRYSKNGLLDRLNQYFFVNELTEEYFGEEIFKQGGLINTSTLYVLTKSKDVSLDLEEKIVLDKKLCEEGPLVSVLLPCYNHEEFVAEAIESVIKQSYKNIEIIVMDDASTDGTAEIMKKYSLYFAKEFYLTENRGGDTTILFEHAKGKYVALMHSDDVWEIDKLALQVQYLEKHPEIDICLSWSKYTDSESKEIKNNRFIQKNRSNYEWMKYFWLNGNALCNPSSLMKKEVAGDLPIFGSCCRQLPDFFKWVYMTQKYSIYIIPKVLIKMKRYEKENSINMSASTIENRFRYMVEEGANWLWVLRDMDSYFFKKAFGELLINPEAETEEEIKCEKYFLLLNHRNMFVQNSAYTYINEVYKDVKECLKKNYNYTQKNISEDMIIKGLAKIF